MMSWHQNLENYIANRLWYMIGRTVVLLSSIIYEKYYWCCFWSVSTNLIHHGRSDKELMKAGRKYDWRATFHLPVLIPVEEFSNIYLRIEHEKITLKFLSKHIAHDILIVVCRYFLTKFCDWFIVEMSKSIPNWRTAPK